MIIPTAGWRGLFYILIAVYVQQVRQEMVEEKGLAPESADKIGGFVNGNAGGAKELWAKLSEENKFGDHPVS